MYDDKLRDIEEQEIVWIGVECDFHGQPYNVVHISLYHKQNSVSQPWLHLPCPCDIR